MSAKRISNNNFLQINCSTNLLHIKNGIPSTTNFVNHPVCLLWWACCGRWKIYTKYVAKLPLQKIILILECLKPRVLQCLGKGCEEPTCGNQNPKCGPTSTSSTGNCPPGQLRKCFCGKGVLLIVYMVIMQLKGLIHHLGTDKCITPQQCCKGKPNEIPRCLTKFAREPTCGDQNPQFGPIDSCPHGVQKRCFCKPGILIIIILW